MIKRTHTLSSLQQSNYSDTGAMMLLNSLDMTPGQSGEQDSNLVTTLCLTNMLHRYAGDCLYPEGIVNVMVFTTPGSVTGSE